MPIPKSVTKIDRNGVTFISNVDRINYTLDELTRAALRDTGKYVCRMFRKNYYSAYRRKKGNIGRFTQYWVRKRDLDLQVGLKPSAWYGMYQELGTSKQKKMGLLSKTVEENIAMIRTIQGQYLSAIEDEQKALSLIDEGDYEGGGENE